MLSRYSSSLQVLQLLQLLQPPLCLYSCHSPTSSLFVNFLIALVFHIFSVLFFLASPSYLLFLLYVSSFFLFLSLPTSASATKNTRTSTFWLKMGKHGPNGMPAILHFLWYTWNMNATGRVIECQWPHQFLDSLRTRSLIPSVFEIQAMGIEASVIPGQKWKRDNGQERDDCVTHESTENHQIEKRAWEITKPYCILNS